jgi:arylsulfatase A-like enzyme
MNTVPVGTFTPSDTVRPWDSLSDDEQRLISGMAEVYAGFSEYTDAQVGRMIDYLEESGQLDNTLIFYCGHDGASGEGSTNGSVNEGKFFNSWPDTIGEDLPLPTGSAAQILTTTTRGGMGHGRCRALGTTRAGHALDPRRHLLDGLG